MNRIMQIGFLVLSGCIICASASANELILTVKSQSSSKQSIALMNQDGMCPGLKWEDINKNGTLQFECEGNSFTLMSPFNQKCNELNIPGGEHTVYIDKNSNCSVR